MIDRTKLSGTIGVDTGGTFTDFVYLDETGAIRVDKRPSLPADPARPVLEGLSEDFRWKNYRVVHGTTVATNALLEDKVAATALIATSGFEDVLEIGRQNRPVLYDIHPRKPRPLIPRGLRFGVHERILHDGKVLVALDTMEVRDVLDRIGGLGIRCIAVCLLHSYANPVHEEAVGKMAEGMGFSVSLSCHVLPEFREYERTATVVVNACLLPIMEGYLKRLEQGIGLGRLSVMQSSGGIIPAAIAARLPVHTILSGPAGGVTAAARKASLLGLERLITFDMGGTSTDVSLYDRGPILSSNKIVAGHPIRVPVIDIHTVGAGGGSIAFLDSGGGLKVGPVSAGADPGPVCYGKGLAITVTDANLFLGRIEPSFFLGGKMKIHPERVRGAMEELAVALSLDLITAAQGIITVINAVMERAIRVISVERGHDPRDFTLVSFGGAGGLHAVELARCLGIPRVLVPRDAGVFSAYGMAVADVTRDLSRTILRKVGQVPAVELDALFGEMIHRGAHELGGEGRKPLELAVEKALDMRYEGQSHEITVPFSDDPAEAFHRAHERLYGYARTGSEVEIVTVRARLIAAVSRPPEAPQQAVRASGRAKPVTSRPLIYSGKKIEARIFDRQELEPGDRVEGAALVSEACATLFLPPGAVSEVDGYGNIIVECGGSFS